MTSTATKAFLADSCATLLINGSFSIQKLGHRDVEQAEEGSRAHLKSPRWWLGFLIMATGICIHIVALPYADMTLLAANSSLAIMGNLILSMYLFDEKWVWKYDCTALILICAGCFSIALMADKSQKEYDGAMLLDKLRAPVAIAFYCFVFSLMALTMYVMKLFEKALRQFETDADLIDHNTQFQANNLNLTVDPKRLIFPPKELSEIEQAEAEERKDSNDNEEVTEELPAAVVSDRPLRILIETINEMDYTRLAEVSERSKSLKWGLKIPMVMLILLAAVVSGTSVLLMKIVDTMVQQGDFADYWYFMIGLGCLVAFTADSQLQFLNQAIKLYDQLEVIPTYQTFVMLSWISIGLLIYGEYVMYTSAQLLGITAAMATCLLGVKFLTMKRKSLRGQDEKNLEGNPQSSETETSAHSDKSLNKRQEIELEQKH